MTNNPKKIEELVRLGITVDQRIPVETNIHNDNEEYLKTKVKKMSHLLSITENKKNK